MVWSGRPHFLYELYCIALRCFYSPVHTGQLLLSFVLRLACLGLGRFLHDGYDVGAWMIFCVC
jgi:hypothetical protein